MFISPSGNTILCKANCFIYEECIYEIDDGVFRQVASKYIGKKIPLKDKYISKYIKRNGSLLLITLEWIGAPELFLKKNNFINLDVNEYKDSIKQSRKKKK